MASGGAVIELAGGGGGTGDVTTLEEAVEAIDNELVSGLASTIKQSEVNTIVAEMVLGRESTFKETYGGDSRQRKGPQEWHEWY